VVEGNDELFPWDDSYGPASERPGRVEMRPIPERATYLHYSTITGKGKTGHFNRELARFRKKPDDRGKAEQATLYREMFHDLIKGERPWRLATAGKMPFSIPVTCPTKRAKRGAPRHGNRPACLSQ